MNNRLIEIDNVIINKEIIETKFTCDLNKCKGACCTMESKYGAPLLEEEIEIIGKNLEIIKEFLPPEHIEAIDREGFWFQEHGEFMTRSLNDRACVFVVHENDIALCGIERAYKAGKIDFVKPVSCHLFPIRISNFGGPVLRYEKYEECLPALTKGKETSTTIIEFCREALARVFGSDWLAKFKKVTE
ncbi:hypothetical protein MROS_1126 [Melioribacter roseus P3M-2]|uniref:DUF3109 family protein n=1 Tax=Melioribacter roseus (strain DSM 23840 / JCM 17771 / VKM B-2668 / P3M-2) TaxID=1191523 RepID=I6Z5D1_MELRP|nr:DUF3109 family protein [Melioribacter roseus]AFN74365.1 hypothetical protein MROS_1126 [Melioribacter roseus P3M-2]